MIKNFIVSSFSSGLLLSLICSLSIQPIHADVQIAESAETTQPLRSGQRAPAFEVRDVNGEVFEFDPNAMSRPAVIIT